MDNEPVAHGLLALWGTRHDNGGMVIVNEPQVWTIIGGFLTAIFAMLGVVTTSFNRTVRTEIGGLRGEMNAKFERVDAQFERVDAQFERVDAQFERVYDRLNYLDRDVQAITRRVFPEGE